MTSPSLMEEEFIAIINFSAPENFTSKIEVNPSVYISKTNKLLMGLIYTLGRDSKRAINSAFKAFLSVIIAATVGNLAVICTIIRAVDRNVKRNYFMVNLAVADLLLGMSF